MIRVRITQPPSRSRTRDSPSAVRMLARTSPLVLRRPGGLSGVPRTRSHLELGRQTHQRPWYCVSRHGRVGRRQACPAQDHRIPSHDPDPRPTAPVSAHIGAGWSSPVARQAHNLKVAGSNPAPATNTPPPQDHTQPAGTRQTGYKRVRHTHQHPAPRAAAAARARKNPNPNRGGDSLLC